MQLDDLVLVVVQGQQASTLHIAAKGQTRSLCGKRHSGVVDEWAYSGLKWCGICPSKEERLINPPTARVDLAE